MAHEHVELKKFPGRSIVCRGTPLIRFRETESLTTSQPVADLLATSGCPFSAAASLAFSAAIAGPNCAITVSRLNDAAFCRGGYLTKFSICPATTAWAAYKYGA